MALPLQTLAVAGPGLIGGSLALAARLAGLTVVVWSHDPEEVELVRAAGFVASPDPAILAEADAVALCTPPPTLTTVADRIGPYLSPAASVTEVASVKGGIESALRQRFGARYVSSHPMAGTARAGFGAAQTDLFHGRRCLLLPGGAPEHEERIGRLWRTVGGELLSLPAGRHDATVARISHLPVLIATAMVHTAGRQPDCLAASGPGFLDTTRIASGPPPLWRSILTANRAAVQAALADFSAELEALRGALAEPDGGERLEQLLARASSLRSDLTPGSAKS
ncbi:MAG: prephenate dehydrogenase/arogenate dehydrogenase family protein [Verrucomicrobia bacterium]|nr:prephenate dehydrogenase/arogenate dehydrogenase family protein [Verrucomicrobiota bacterium]